MTQRTSATRLGAVGSLTARLALGALLLAGLMVGTPAAMAAGDSDPAATGWIIGSNGELLQLHAGLYGDLFPEGVDALADAAVLALEIERDGVAERLLVPQTGSRQAESSYRLIHDGQAGVSYMVWESTVNGIHPLIHVVGFDGASWSEVREITGSVFSDKGHPQLAVTRDSYELGEGKSFDRTVLHIVWWERVGGTYEKRYAPVVLENGRFLETQTVRSLSFFGLDETQESHPTLLDQAVRLQPGPNPDSVLLGYIDPATSALASLQLEVLPQALSRLAATAAAALRSLPEDAPTSTVEDTLRQVLMESGAGFQEAVLESMLEDLLLLLGEVSEHPGGMESAADEMGARIVIIGMRTGSNGLEDEDPGQMLQIRRGEADFDHHLELRLRGHWPEPGAGEGARVFLSPSGTSSLVAWPSDEAKAVTYRIGLSSGEWTEPATLALRQGLDLEGAMSLLEARILTH